MFVHFNIFIRYFMLYRIPGMISNPWQTQRKGQENIRAGVKP